jgi:hypothetical protein
MFRRQILPLTQPGIGHGKPYFIINIENDYDRCASGLLYGPISGPEPHKRFFHGIMRNQRNGAQPHQVQQDRIAIFEQPAVHKQRKPRIADDTMGNVDMGDDHTQDREASQSIQRGQIFSLLRLDYSSHRLNILYIPSQTNYRFGTTDILLRPSNDKRNPTISKRQKCAGNLTPYIG